MGIASHDDPGRYLTDLEQVRGHRRVWFLFSCSFGHTATRPTERAIFVSFLNRVGRRLEMHTGIGARSYLDHSQWLAGWDGRR